MVWKECMKKYFVVYLTAFAISLLPAYGHAQGSFLKLGTVLDPTHPTSQALRYFQQEIGNMSDSRINIQIFPDSQLGTAQEILEGIRFGNIEIGVLSSEMLVSLSPPLSAVSMPYIFRDDGHRFRVLDGPLGRKLLDSLEKYNLIGLGFLDTGMKNLVTKHQFIKVPKDLKEIPIGRTRNCSEDDCQNPTEQIAIHTLTALGARIEALPWEDVYRTLQSENLAGWESNEPDCLSLSIFETGALYFTYSRHISIPDVLVASKIWFDSLSPQMREAIREAARLTERQQRVLWTNFVQEAIARLEAAGVKFETVAREPFYRAVQPVYSKMYEELGPEFEEVIHAIMAVK
jgi:TRAP-type C4-dicarboxylate transport system substrate-binding protein